MLTYIINTSENKTFDSNLMFELAGYNKIRWMHFPLNSINQCATEICEKQGMLGADKFRIAVIIDYFGFDRVRTPYGRRGFESDTGVDISLYMPYIEAYLTDNLIASLERRALFAEELDVYYVHNDKIEHYECIQNSVSQLKQVLAGVENISKQDSQKLVTIAKDAGNVKYGELLDCRESAANESLLSRLQKEERRGDEQFSVFLLCKEICAGDTLEIHFSDGAVKTTEIEKIFETDGKQASSVYKYGTKFILLFAASETAADLYCLDIPANFDTNGDIIGRTENVHSAFELYCTPKLSLRFDLVDYPYGSDRMTFIEFFEAFRARMAMSTGIKRHFCTTSYGGGAPRVALDTLSLSLYLIRTFEREESVVTDDDLDVKPLDPEKLKDVLEEAWSKVSTAKALTRKNKMSYYSLSDMVMLEAPADKQPEDEEAAIMKEKASLPESLKAEKISAEAMHGEVTAYASRTPGEVDAENRAEFDQIMAKYLQKRDETRAIAVENEFNVLKASGVLKTTEKCPSREEYEHIIETKQKDIAAIFERVLAADYKAVDYTEEKQKADKAFEDYKRAKACLQKNIIGDLIFMILTLAVMWIPYYALQLNSAGVGTVDLATLTLYSCGFFAGLFILAFGLHILPLTRKLKDAKRRILDSYLNCRAKARYSFSAIRRRYEEDLLAIETARYEMRRLKSVYEANIEKERNVNLHHKMLDGLEDCLSSILNNLNVEPKLREAENINGEFDITKPCRSKENRIYRVFSIETIEKLFSKKGSDAK